ncbi:large ribosomal subunit protein uL18m [Heteronotia binoei]|uniref:large ribosomal subunit protein uL18m-like n=1 Tax=Heteronotia binoei TaxID=13085 RepID=UPI00292DF130|nr:large ribosomal subunit protein uL18m-like [Heteronotia binoei]XP_060097728.1 large ribosomal subunit protein uL18m [Heteronotia binoei]
MALRRWTSQLGTAAKGFLRAGQGVRFSSAISSSTTSVENGLDTTENEIVAPDFTNRNPRNLEQLALARKERGWRTTWPKQDYWHRLRLEQTQNHVEANVEHCSGHIVVSASTREWAIKKYLHRTTGVAACVNVGHVLAQRCLEAGINFVEFQTITPWEKCSDSIQSFQNAVSEGGVVLKELRRIYE